MHSQFSSRTSNYKLNKKGKDSFYPRKVPKFPIQGHAIQSFVSNNHIYILQNRTKTKLLILQGILEIQRKIEHLIVSSCSTCLQGIYQRDTPQPKEGEVQLVTQPHRTRYKSPKDFSTQKSLQRRTRSIGKYERNIIHSILLILSFHSMITIFL